MAFLVFFCWERLSSHIKRSANGHFEEPFWNILSGSLSVPYKNTARSLFDFLGPADDARRFDLVRRTILSTLPPSSSVTDVSSRACWHAACPLLWNIIDIVHNIDVGALAVLTIHFLGDFARICFFWSIWRALSFHPKKTNLAKMGSYFIQTPKERSYSIQIENALV